MRTQRLQVIVGMIAAAGLLGCDSGGSDAVDDDFDIGDGGVVLPDGRVDRDRVGGDTQITIDGTVFVEGAPDRGEGGDFDPPSGAPVTSGGRVDGTGVFVLDIDGNIIRETVTNGRGQFEIPAPAAPTPIFLYVQDIEGYAGAIRYEQQRGGGDYEAYDIVLPSIEGLAEVAAMSGTVYDGNRGWVAAGVNAADEARGGEGAEVVGAAHDPAFNLLPGGVKMGNRLAPVCGSDGSPSGCVDERTKQIFFPNVAPGQVSMRALDPPAGGDCELRFDVPTWRVEPHTLTVVNVDCNL